MFFQEKEERHQRSLGDHQSCHSHHRPRGGASSDYVSKGGATSLAWRASNSGAKSSQRAV